MVGTTSRKNKVVLSDYNYRRDIENRLLLAQLSVFDVDVLNEVINSSLTFSIAELAEQLEVPSPQIIASLEKLLPTKLFRHDGCKIYVDKELRKYYEFQIQKFDDDFAPDLDFAFKALKRVPIHIFPTWYSILRTTDDIQVSIIERCLQTPKIYKRHLAELNFDDPILLAIVKDVMDAEDYKVRSTTLREKYALSEEAFEEYLLLLEFNFVCFLSYNKVDGMWQEVVTPLHEWREFLRFQNNSRPTSIPEALVARKYEGGEFAFVQDMSSLLAVLQQQPLKVEEIGGKVRLPYQALALWPSALGSHAKEEGSAYLNALVRRLLALHLVEVKEEHLQATVESHAWLRKLPQDQALLLYRLPVDFQDYPGLAPTMLVEKNFRSLERALKRVMRMGWIGVADFLKGMSEPLGTMESVTLRQKGRRWSYVLPHYGEAERLFVQEVILHRLFEIGIVSVGTHQDQLCFCVTPFGRLAIGD